MGSPEFLVSNPSKQLLGSIGLGGVIWTGFQLSQLDEKLGNRSLRYSPSPQSGEVCSGRHS
jgi:hypothetical protein